jgi:penicillin-binding protein 1A
MSAIPVTVAPRRRGRRVLAVLLALLVFFAVAWYFCFFQGCPDVHRLAAHVAGGAPVLVDRDGRAYGDLAPVEGELVSLKSLPEHVPEAFVAVEDKRFRDHGAVDVRRIFGALVSNVRSGGIDEGSSTITMQLARNVFPEQLPGQKRTFGRKFLEVRVAFEIESRFTKDQILEMYLNHIYFGNGAKGIEAAARHYFGRAATKLTLPQAALLAALPKAPSHYDPRRHPKAARERRDLVLTLMEEQKRITPAQAAAAKKAGLGVVSRPRARRAAAAPVAGWFVEEVRRQLEEAMGSDLYRAKLKVHTTLDLNAQRAAEEELARQLAAIESGSLGPYRAPRYSAALDPSTETTPYLQGAVVAMEAETGDVLAWVGGRDFRHSHFDRVKGARRQAGSAFKPFVYAAALESGRALNQAVSDEPLRITDGRRTWEPRNFDGRFDGRVTLRDALVRSKNVATVRLAQEVGIRRVQELAEEAGVEPPIPDQPSMALGTVSVSPLELTTAFTTFATLGERVTPRLVTKVVAGDGEVVWQAEEPERERVLEPSIAYLVTDALREALVRGTGQAVSQAGFRAPAAGKTGTTNDGADAWFVGYTPDVVATVWVGFDERRPIVARATGGRVAAPVWARTMMRLYQRRSRPGGWAKPADVIEGFVDPASGMLLASGCRPWAGTAYRELFVRGNAPTTVCPSRGEVSALEPWELPPLPDIEEGMETGVPLEELMLEPPVGMDGPELPADDAAAMEASPPPVPGSPAPGETATPAPTIGFAPSSPAPPSPRAVVPPAEPPAGTAATPRPAVTARPAPEATPPPAGEPEDEEPAPRPSPTPPAG